jgi:multiple sugar transport system permease protein
MQVAAPRATARLGTRTARRPAARLATRPLLYAFLIVCAFLTAFPFYWMLIGSFMTPVELFSPIPRLWPSRWDPSAYARVFDLVPLARYFANSFITSGVTMIGGVIICSAAGYAFAMLSFPGRTILFGLTLATLMVPYQSRVIPLFVMFANYGLLNTYLGIILPGLAGAFGVFLMRQFFGGLPKELRESALIDGASEVRIFAQIFLPLARPAVATLALFLFLQSWDQLLWPMIVAPRPDMRTLQVGLAFINQTALTWNHTMAAVVLAVVPIVIAFVIAQRQFIAGIAAGAVKE